jgi:hypothetical protein
VLAEVGQRELDQIGRAIEVIAGDRVDDSVGWLLSTSSTR